MEGDNLSQNSGDNSKRFAFSRVTVASPQALQAVVPDVRSRAGVTGAEAGIMLWRALNAVHSGGSWEPFSVLGTHTLLLATGLGERGLS